MGISIVWKMGPPTCTLLSGIEVNQPDLPWWVTGILGWLAMVRAIQDSPERAWRTAIQYTLESEPPTAVRDLYEDFVSAMEAEGS